MTEVTADVFKLKNAGEQLAKLERECESILSHGRCEFKDTSVLRVCDGAKLHILSRLPCLRIVVASDEPAAKSLVRRLLGYGVSVKFLPHRDDMLIARKGVSRAGRIERMNTLADLADGSVQIVVTTADGLLQKFPSRRLVSHFTVKIKTEDVKSPTSLADALALAGYRRQDMIFEIGDFALRGDILDVFASDGKAYRINFFDEFIESIKLLDPESMLSLGELKSARFVPLDDVLADEAGVASARERLAAYASAKYAAQAIDGVRVGVCSSNWAMPFVEGGLQTLIEYCSEGEDFLLVFDEPRVVHEKLLLLEKEFSGRVKTLGEGGEIVREHANLMISVHELKRQLLLKHKLAFCALDIGNPIFQPQNTVNVNSKPVTKYYLAPESIGRDIRAFSANGAKVILATGSRERAKSVLKGLREYEVLGEYSEDGSGDGAVLVTPLCIDTGVIYPVAKLVIIGVSECVGKCVGWSITAPKAKFDVPKAGDYVVHRVHGIGLCEGTTLMRTGEFEREYIVLKYRDGDVLYVATDQMNNLQKFVGEGNPPLNKLGGKEFEREKEKVKKSVHKLAINLAELYAKREQEKGFVYAADTVWQKEFEDAFEYEETEDQLKAIAEIKADMEGGRIMDRLLVGDVGFGKTEVAFRAIFKTVLDGKQAVLLAPTTILARQHYENLVERLKPFGIKCGLLSRLKSTAENDALIRELKCGTAHIVVATHKVLAKRVEFSDLGLLVLDEEQRFGVEHKELLKSKHPLVNVLTLSATPIPRTLNMSLAGVRDISMLETPPQGRLPIQTYVLEYSDALLADAVNRELARGGQTFVLVNNISLLDKYARTIGELCPEARVVTAHGQMPPALLEDKMSAFYDKRFDVLVSTAIIENGIDIPCANTLVVIDSGRFGLAQLYQLRGRVGRRGELAHAYFTIPTDGAITENAEKRLKTLLENTEIGSGFKVSMADLSIRGAGTLLGVEQSGHIEKVGYEMYLELLDDAIKEIRTGVSRKPTVETEMRVDAAAYIREGFVGAKDKMRIYKRIADVSGKSARDALVAELTDIYGQVDLPLENLINIALLKNLAMRFDVSRIVVNKNGAGANFSDADVFKNEALMKAVSSNADKVLLTSTIPPTLIFEANGKTAEQKLAMMIDFFATAEQSV